MTVIGNPLAEDLRRCCDMYEAALNELRATAKQYLAAATAYHQSPHDIAIHARYGAARSELVRVLGLEEA